MMTEIGAMNAGMPAWRVALARLEAGEGPASVRPVVAPEVEMPGPPIDRWVSALLRSELAPRDAPPDALPQRPADAGGETAAARVGRTLVHVRDGRLALPEGRVDAVVEHVRRAHASLPQGEAWLTLRVASLYQAAFRFSGDRALLERGVTLASAIVDDLARPEMAVAARSVLATFHVLTGRLYALADACDAAIELARATDAVDERSTAMAHQFRGYALFEWDRVGEAEEELRRAWELSGPDALGVRTGTARLLAAVRSASGDPDGARSWMSRLEKMVGEPATLRNREWLAAVRIRVGIGTDRDLRAFDRWRHGYAYESIDADDVGMLASRLHELESLLTVLEAFGRHEAMLEVSDLLLRGSRPARSWFAARALTGRAVALTALGRSRGAAEALHEALEHRAAGGFVRCYLEGDGSRRDLLEQAVGAGNPHAAHVLDAARDGVEATGSLTPRQREVLVLVAAGHSNRDLAEALGVAETTVKTHLRAIYAHLDVGSRTAAAAAARKRGLLR